MLPSFIPPVVAFISSSRRIVSRRLVNNAAVVAARLSCASPQALPGRYTFVVTGVP
jgi:hypothetical protein